MNVLFVIHYPVFGARTTKRCSSRGRSRARAWR
jgi:hypothetical protein